MKTKLWTVLLSSVLAIAGSAACSAAEDEGLEVDDSELAATALDDAKLVARGRDEAIQVPAKGKLVYEVTQPELLARLEKDGYSVARPFGASRRMANDALYRSSPFYKGLSDAITKDVADLRAQDSRLTTRVVDGQRRVFDTGWLRSPHATYDLVAVLNRIDRKDFAVGTCGEVRFVYRLSYVKREGNVTNFSRMPFFFNVLYSIPGGDCAGWAKKWLVNQAMNEGDYVKFLETSPLDLSKLTIKQVEVNAQVVRTPSELQTDMGGQAEYFLRIYRQTGNVTELLPLENTPDVTAISANGALKQELLTWVSANVDAIDRGVAQVPNKFLARKATSFTTAGSSRLANKPFSRIFSPNDLGAVDLSRTKVVASKEGLLARLDDLTCSGCHQGRSVAGFHMLGFQRGSRTHPLNALRSFASPHYLADRDRRSKYLYTLAGGGTPDVTRPFSFAPSEAAGARLGMQCIPDSEKRHFRTPFSCVAGTTCKTFATNAQIPVELGQCMPSSGGFAGLPCMKGETNDRTNPREDTMSVAAQSCAGGNYFCLQPEEGTPAGMCSGQCSSVGAVSQGGNEICAFGAIGDRFDACAASQNVGSCIESSVRPAPRTACDDATPCREDYMCQRLEPLTGNAPTTTTPSGKGFCNPTYFIFQMRLDGHPTPM